MEMTASIQNRLFLAGVMVLSMMAHLWAVPALNMIEDESAYLQDGAQTTLSYLPFREFGGTKGPLYLFALHGWQSLIGRSVEGSRLFSSLLHVASIPLFFVLARRWLSKPVAWYAATVLWALSAVIVSLTSNVTHIPFELLLVFLGMWLVTKPEPKRWHLLLGGVLFLAACISRATAVAFGPVFLYLLLAESGRWRRFLWFAAGFLLVLLITLAIVWPNYGWPKTAFFFNADAVLIAKGQGESYGQHGQVSPARALFLATQPLWLDSFALIGVAVCVLPLVGGRRLKIPLTIGSLVILLYAARSVGEFTFTAEAADPAFLRSVTRSMLLCLMALSMVAAASQSVVKIGSRRIWWLAALWLGAFFLFYKGWGRAPTPFYPLESTPMIALLAGTVLAVWHQRFVGERKNCWIFPALLICIMLDTVFSLRLLPSFQYRGSIEMGPVREMSAMIEQKVPADEPLFTAQPVFAFATGRELWGGYTHPGWYLSERAGYMPAEIRRVFLPDMPQLVKEVDSSINWIVVDWRTHDVYFNEGAEETEGLRSLLENEFHQVARVENPASKDIFLYERNEHVRRHD